MPDDEFEIRSYNGCWIDSWSRENTNNGTYLSRQEQSQTVLQLFRAIRPPALVNNCKANTSVYPLVSTITSIFRSGLMTVSNNRGRFQEARGSLAVTFA